MKKIIYFDHHATTPMDARVLKAMLPYLKEDFGNPSSSTHALGKSAREAVERARESVARLIGAHANEIYFTSGASESNNLALKGIAAAYKDKGNHILTVCTEHKTVLDPCKRLALEGAEVTYLPVQSNGLIDLETLKKSIKPSTILISVMFANNEIGVIQPIAQIGKIAKEKGILFHCDAAQALGWVAVDVQAMGIDLLSLSGHKIYGPKGVGALYVRKENPRVKLTPLFDGGGQETGFRSGTLNVPGIVGLGEACEIAYAEREKNTRKVKALRDYLRQRFLALLPDWHENGDLQERLPNNWNVSIQGVDAEEVLKRLKNVALSTGSACLSSSPERSYTLKALGLSDERCRSALRFGLGCFNTQGDVDALMNQLAPVVRDIRKRSAL